ncbi:MAG TPA: SdpI family protein, partial [Leptospiraceae bacterium]|nr:SdpI family protein [Leptospiraceae bacterium]
LLFYGICLRYFGFQIPEDKMIFIVVLSIFTAIGNYMRNFRPNYFVGIRTPWTLENETVWKKTHELGGKLFFYNGLIGILICIILDGMILPFLVLGLILIACLIPIFYSYFYYKKLKSNSKS